MIFFCFFFFFSSRRRHTRFSRDWSSDVCSSDLNVGRAADHQQMFDIVTAHENEAAAGVDACVIDHAKAWLASARIGTAKPAGSEAPYHPGERTDQSEDDQERNEESHG